MPLKPSTGSLGAFGISLSTMAPTLAMSFTTPLVAQAAGSAVPLAFLAGGSAVAIVACSFIAFSRRFVGAGSIMAYVEVVFGKRAAFVAGWTLLLVYVMFATGSLGMAGRFAAAALAHGPVGGGSFGWVVIGAAVGVVVPWLASRRIATTAHILLVLELVSVLAIVGLAAVILSRSAVSLAPLRINPGKGLPGLGLAMVSSIIAFAGFETAATLSEETRDPTRAIPRAIIAAIAVVTAFFVLVSYAQVLGYGIGDVTGLAAATAPLDALSTKYVSGGFGIFLDVAAAVSAGACALSSTMAAARILYALGRHGLATRLTVLDATHDTPRMAVLVISAISLLAVLLGAEAGADGYTGATFTIGILALIVLYVTVCVAQAVHARRRHDGGAAAIGVAGAVLLLWPLYASLYPVPAWPSNLWPFVVVTWIIVGSIVVALHPGIRSARTRMQLR